MATIKAISSKAPIGTAINYVSQEEKTEQKLQSGIGCEPETALDEMQTTKAAWNKTGGREYMHYVQSFKPGETTPGQAQAIGKELAENNKAWQGFEVLVTTHKDREHIHNHFIVNSVSYEDGHKIQSSPQDLEKLKALSDEICKREGLSIVDRSGPRTAENVTAYKKDTYKILKEAEQGTAESYVQNIAAAVVEAKQTAKSQEEFIEKMNSRGYSVDWQENHKNITFTDIKREQHGEKKSKVRNSRLEKYYNIDFSKEGLTNEFEENRARASRTAEPERGLAESIDRAKEQTQPTNSRIDRMQAELDKIRKDRERAAQHSAGSNRSGSGRTGSTPDREQETESRDITAERTTGSIAEQPQNRSGINAEIERIRAELQTDAEREQQEAERERNRVDAVKAGERENSEEQRILKTGADENKAEASRVGTEQQDVKREQSGVDKKLRGTAESQRSLDREHGNLERKHSGIDADHRGLKGKQQHIVGQQRSIGDRIRKLGDRVKEALKQAFRGRRL